MAETSLALASEVSGLENLLHELEEQKLLPNQLRNEIGTTEKYNIVGNVLDTFLLFLSVLGEAQRQISCCGKGPSKPEGHLQSAVLQDRSSE